MSNEATAAPVEATETSGLISVSVPAQNSTGFRANRALGKVIPIGVVALLYYGFTFVVLEVGPYLIFERQRDIYGGIYVAGFLMLYLPVISTYLWIYFLPRNHSSPPRDPPKQVLDKLVVYECSDASGTPASCSLDRCNGAFRPIRARHCKDCGVCKMGFDHHCSWMNHCITTPISLKPFLVFVTFAALLIFWATMPLHSIVLAQIREVVSVMWSDGPSGSALRDIWWSRWWGWAGGPIWRYAGALVLGFLYYPSPDHLPSDHTSHLPPLRWVAAEHINDGKLYKYEYVPYHRLSLPSLFTLLIVTIATFVALVACAMVAIIIQNLRRGVTTVDIERERRWNVLLRNERVSREQGKEVGKRAWDPRLKLWIPDGEGKGGGKVVVVEPGRRIFDMGPGENWRGAIGTSFLDWIRWSPSKGSRLVSSD